MVPATLDLARTPFSRPCDLPIGYQVMRVAYSPVSNRWAERDTLRGFEDAIVRGVHRQLDDVTAPTGAEVRAHFELPGPEELAGGDGLGEPIDHHEIEFHASPTQLDDPIVKCV